MCGDEETATSAMPGCGQGSLVVLQGCTGCTSPSAQGPDTKTKPWRQRVPAHPPGGPCGWHCPHPLVHPGLFSQHPASLPTRVSVPAAPEMKALRLGKTQGDCHPRCRCHQRGRSGPSVAWVGRGSLSGCASGSRLCPAQLSDRTKKTFAQTQPGPLPR